MYAEIAINIEAPLDQNFHYAVPRDLRARVRVGQLVEVEFGSRLAQGIVVGYPSEPPPDVDEFKPLINIIESQPVVWAWQIKVAEWLSEMYLTPLNACLRLFLPLGMTRWAEVTVGLNPYWDGEGKLTAVQTHIIEILREKGDLHGGQLRHALPKSEQKSWLTAVNQLAKRGILRKATRLEPPRIRPKKIQNATLLGSPKQILSAIPQFGRASKAAELLYALLTSPDPLPAEASLLAETGAEAKHLQQLLDEGLVVRVAGAEVAVPDGEAGEVWQTNTAVSLALPHAQIPPHLWALRRATKLEAILHLLAQAAQPVALSEIYAQTKSGINDLRKLEKAGLIRFGAEEVWRDPLADRDFVPATAPPLTHDQARIWGRVKVAMLLNQPAETAEEEEEVEAIDIDEVEEVETTRPFLLHGVTGSGKTEIYMRAVELALEFGQQAIILVPEIALTPQTVRRFAARFPGRVAILHSRLTEGERYDTWRRARQGLFDIIVGPRSALFTPFPRLGLIVVDEEHDPSYKQTPPIPAPYYHGRDLAVAMGKITGATIILGSATPDLVSYHHGRADRYTLLELPRRVMGHRQRLTSQAERLQITATQYQQQNDDPDDALTIPLPPIQIVDLRQELRAGNRSIFSRELQTALDETISRHEQAILFLNRRGTASFVICRDCGHQMACPNCDLPLTYHRPNFLLTCHHCGYKEPNPTECPVCASKRIKHFGLGTEELAEQVAQRWPNARLVRWDRDTTAGRDSHETLLASFINHESDVLIGTQMIAKGLDLPLVTLVGIISADVALGLPDYRTGERAFQLLAQVAGRAGRGLLGGRVILQTYQPEHYAIQAAAEHDYVGFYLEEIRFRTQHHLPPFRRLAKLVFSDVVHGRGQQEAQRLADALRWHAHELKLSATEILGPHPPFFSRIDRHYRWQIIIRAPDPRRLLADFTIPKGWLLDLDPVSTL
jgi:primosomal protein N' (replication factor Y) (superfamily II helicase)